MADEKAISLVGNWLNDMKPFDVSDEKILMSFSTGFFSVAEDGGWRMESILIKLLMLEELSRRTLINES